MADATDLQAMVWCGNTVTLPRLMFTLDKTVEIPSGTILDGAGAVIVTDLHDKHTFLVRDCNDVCIRNLDIQGCWSTDSGDDPATLGAAIQVQHSNHVQIENVKISGMMGRGIVASSDVEDLTIRGCHISDCSISIFLFKGIRAGIIESNRIFNSRIIGIYVDDATQGDTAETAIPNHLTMIRGNIIVGGGTSPRNTGFGIAVSASTDTVIANNIVRSFGHGQRIGHGIVLNNGQASYHQGRRTVVCGNVLSDHTGYGLYVVEQEHFVESGNVYSGNGLADCMVR